MGRDHSTADIEFTNRSSLPIRRIILIAKYADQAGKTIVAIPFHASDRSGEPASFDVFLLPNARFLEKPIMPGERVSLVGATAVIAKTCPVAAEIEFAEVLFTDGSHQQWSNPVDLDSDVDVLPEYFDAKGCTISEGLDVLVTLTISTSGKARVDHADGASAASLGCLRRELTFWYFTPEVKGGKSVESQRFLLLSFQAPNVIPSYVVVKRDLAKYSKMSVARLMKEQSDRWSILYGSGCCTRVVRSRKLYPKGE